MQAKILSAIILVGSVTAYSSAQAETRYATKGGGGYAIITITADTDLIRVSDINSAEAGISSSPVSGRRLLLEGRTILVAGRTMLGEGVSVKTESVSFNDYGNFLITSFAQCSDALRSGVMRYGMSGRITIQMQANFVNASWNHVEVIPAQPGAVLSCSVSQL